MILDNNSVGSYMAGLTVLRSKIVGWQFRTVICNNHDTIAEAYHAVFGARGYSLHVISVRVGHNLHMIHVIRT